MTIKLAYIISMLICYVPRFAKTFIYNHKLSKDGYDYVNNLAFTIHQSKMLLTTVIVSLIPIFNIFKGLETIYELVRFKRYYARHKMDLLRNGFIEKEEKTFGDTLKEINDMFMDATKGSKNEETKNASEILDLLLFIDSKGYDIKDDFEKLDVHERIEYLRKLKKEILDKEKEEINTTTNENEEEKPKKLIKK